jgi:hypothetical protein
MSATYLHDTSVFSDRPASNGFACDSVTACSERGAFGRVQKVRRGSMNLSSRRRPACGFQR